MGAVSATGRKRRKSIEATAASKRQRTDGDRSSSSAETRDPSKGGSAPSKRQGTEGERATSSVEGQVPSKGGSTEGKKKASVSVGEAEGAPTSTPRGFEVR